MLHVLATVGKQKKPKSFLSGLQTEDVMSPAQVSNALMCGGLVLIAVFALIGLCVKLVTGKWAMIEQKANNGTWVFALLGIGLLLLILLFALELPNFGSVTTGAHAIEKHGQDAITARTQLKSCKNLQIKVCPSTPGGYGITTVLWCETGGSLCPGMYVTAGHKEKTSFIRPCSQWRNCQWV